MSEEANKTEIPPSSKEEDESDNKEKGAMQPLDTVPSKGDVAAVKIKQEELETAAATASATTSTEKKDPTPVVVTAVVEQRKEESPKAPAETPADEALATTPTLTITTATSGVTKTDNLESIVTDKLTSVSPQSPSAAAAAAVTTQPTTTSPSAPAKVPPEETAAISSLVATTDVTPTAQSYPAVNPGPNDILFGDNQVAHRNHAGTQEFQKLLIQFLDPYQDFKKRKEQFRVLESMWQHVTHRGRRFLQYKPLEKYYYDLPKAAAMDKIETALAQTLALRLELKVAAGCEDAKKKAAGELPPDWPIKATLEANPEPPNQRQPLQGPKSWIHRGAFPAATLGLQQVQNCAVSSVSPTLQILAAQGHKFASDLISRGGVEIPFPWKLHEMLEDTYHAGQQWIVSWQAHGRCFMVHKPNVFVDLIMPTYFNQSKFASFQRQLNLYGFQRIGFGPDKGAYYHRSFLRGRIDLCHNVLRLKNKGTKVRRRPESEPNLYALPPMPDIQTGPGTVRAAIEASIIQGPPRAAARRLAQQPAGTPASHATIITSSTPNVNTPPPPAKIQAAPVSTGTTAASNSNSSSSGTTTTTTTTATMTTTPSMTSPSTFDQTTPDPRVAGVKRPAPPTSEPAESESTTLQVRELRMQMNHLKEAGAAKDIEIRRLRQELATYSRQARDLRRAGEAKDAEIEKLTEELASKDRKLEKLEMDRGKVIKGLFVKDSWADVDTFQENLYI